EALDLPLVDDLAGGAGAAGVARLHPGQGDAGELRRPGGARVGQLRLAVRVDVDGGAALDRGAADDVPDPRAFVGHADLRRRDGEIGHEDGPRKRVGWEGSKHFERGKPMGHLTESERKDRARQQDERGPYVGEVYRHYKGGLYVVVACSI